MKRFAALVFSSCPLLLYASVQDSFRATLMPPTPDLTTSQKSARTRDILQKAKNTKNSECENSVYYSAVIELYPDAPERPIADKKLSEVYKKLENRIGLKVKKVIRIGDADMINNAIVVLSDLIESCGEKGHDEIVLGQIERLKAHRKEKYGY